MVPCDELLATQIEFTQHFLHPLRVNSKKSILDSKNANPFLLSSPLPRVPSVDYKLHLKMAMDPGYVEHGVY